MITTNQGVPSRLSSMSAPGGKQVLFGSHARNAMLQGVNIIADAVAATMGPKGRTVVLDQLGSAPKITKDGVTVARHVEFSTPAANIGAQLVKAVAIKTNDIAGDGTTTATVLARAMYSGGVSAVGAGMDAAAVRRGMEDAAKQVAAELDKMKKIISTPEEILQVATVSANNDKEIGKLISNAMAKVGKDGIITVQDGKKMHDELDVIEGMKFDSGYISHYLITDTKNLVCEFSNPLYLITDMKITTPTSLVPALEQAHKEGRPIVIIADSVDGEALTTLIINKLRGLQVCAVKAPGFGDNRKQMLQDIAISTGATLLSDELGHKLEGVTKSQLGSSKQVKITQEDTLILSGNGNKKEIVERCESLKSQLSRASSDYEKEKLKERLSKLSGGVAVLKIGGASEVSVGERRDRVDDALNAARAAVTGGIVPGGGVALLRAGQRVKIEREKLRKSKGMEEINLAEESGARVVIEATQVPLKTIVKNAGEEGAVVAQKVLENSNDNFGFDANTLKYCDMVKSGIVDPTLVVKTAFLDAASVAGVMTSSECVISDKPAEHKIPVKYDE